MYINKIKNKNKLISTGLLVCLMSNNMAPVFANTSSLVNIPDANSKINTSNLKSVTYGYDNNTNEEHYKDLNIDDYWNRNSYGLNSFSLNVNKSNETKFNHTIEGYDNTIIALGDFKEYSWTKKGNSVITVFDKDTLDVIDYKIIESSSDDYTLTLTKIIKNINGDGYIAIGVEDHIKGSVNTDSYLIELDKDFNVIKRVVFNNGIDNYFKSLDIIDNTYVISAISYNPAIVSSTLNKYLLKYNEDLNKIKEVPFYNGSTSTDILFNYNKEDGYFYCLDNSYLYKIDTNFNILKTSLINGTPYNLMITADGCITILNKRNDNYIFLEKYDNELNLVSETSAEYDGFWKKSSNLIEIEDGYLIIDTSINKVIKLDYDLQEVDSYLFRSNIDEYQVYEDFANGNGGLNINSMYLTSDGKVIMSGDFENKYNKIENMRYYSLGEKCAFVAQLNLDTMELTGEKPELKGYSEGDGSMENPFLIKTPQELSLMSIHTALGVVNVSHNFKLVNDIDLDTYDWDEDSSNGNFIPIGDNIIPFTGNFDGNNHIIKNLKILYGDRGSKVIAGLFGHTVESTIKDLTFENVDVRCLNPMGALAGRLEASIVDNIKIIGDVHFMGDKYVGGLAGWTQDVSISNIYIDNPKMYGSSGIGGLIGYQYYTNSYSSIKNCIVNNLNMQGIRPTSISGLIGVATQPEIENCHVSGTINISKSGNNADVGGIIGGLSLDKLDDNPEALVKNCTGAIDIKVDDTTNTVNAGGLIGNTSFSDLNGLTVLDNCTYKGSIKIRNGRLDFVGGLIGNGGDGNILNSRSNAILDSNGYEVGGLIGRAGSEKIENSSATGSIKGGGSVGGLLGTSSSSNIRNSFANLTVNGGQYIGGLVGEASSDTRLENCYSATDDGSPVIGKLASYSSSSTLKKNIINVYYDKDINSSTDPLGLPIIGLSTEEMMGQATYDNMDLDYEDVWYVRGDNYPALHNNNTVPIANEYTTSVSQGSDFNIDNYLIASDLETSNENLVFEILKGEIKTSEPGTQQVEFKVTDEGGLSDTGILTINVLEGVPPTITAFDKTVYLGNDFYPLEDVTAKDGENNDLTKEVKVNYTDVDMSKVGSYKVVYEVTDSANITTTKEVSVKVIQGDVNIPVINYDDTYISIEDRGTNIPLTIIEDFDDADNLKFEFSNPNWIVENGSLKSEPIGHNQVTENILTVECEDYSTMVIDIRGSSEATDRGHIYFNESTDSYSIISGKNSDSVVLKLRKGLNKIKFDYDKDYSVSDGDDCIYIDAIYYTSGSRDVDTISYRINGSEWQIYDNEFELDGYNLGDIVLLEVKATSNGIDSAIRKKYITVGGENQAPELFVDDFRVAINSDFNYKDYVRAEDFEDGDITDNVIMKGDFNINEKGEYEVTFEVTDNGGLTVSKTVTITVFIPNRVPVIHVNDLEVFVNSEFNAKDHATATDEEDGDITDRIIVKEDTVNTSVKGDYHVIYEITDNDGVTVTKTIKVSVIDYEEIFPPTVDEAPVIKASNKVLYIGDKFNELDGVTATDKEDGNITQKIKVDYNNVDTSKEGTYKVIYSVEDSNKNKTVKEIKVTVNPVKNEAPVLNIPNKDINVGDKFEPLKGVTAYDKEDGDLTAFVVVKSSNVDSSKPGNYEVTYSVMDSTGNTTTKKITVVVKALSENNSNNSNTNNNGNTSNDANNSNTNKPQTGDYGVIYDTIFVAISFFGLLYLNRKKNVNKK